MTGLCGWVGAPNIDRYRVIQSMAGAVGRGGSRTVRTASTEGGSVAVAALHREAFLYSSGDYLIALHGYLRFVDPVLSSLARGKDVGHALVEGYCRHGTQLLASVAGSFALAIVDTRRSEALLAIDRIGVRSLCYGIVDEALVFGSTLDAIRRFPGVKDEVSLQALYDYVHFHVVPAPNTIYMDRRRLLPGTYLHWRKGVVQSASYWEMRFVENKRRSFSELKEEFRAVIRRSIADAFQGDETGAFLSGGTDSSTVAGMLREVTGRAPRTYSIGFEANGFDEIGYARIAARHFGTRHREYYVTPGDVVSAIPLVAALHDQPFGNSSAVPTYYCAKLASEDGISTLLGGDGGDELFGGNSRYATQYLYSLYGDLPRVVRKAFVEPVVALLPGRGIAAKVQRYMAHSSMPMPARYDHYNLLERLGPTSVFTEDFLHSISPSLPALQYASAYRASHAGSLINRMLALDMKYTLADNDLPKVTRSCELAGVDVRFPLLHDDVVAFAARLPGAYKLRGTRLRYFFKKALADFLPNEILNKTKHGFGLPFGPWLLRHDGLRELVLDSLADLKKRLLVRPRFIDELTSVHVKSHPHYYGTMVWVLLMLEQWLKEHRVSFD